MTALLSRRPVAFVHGHTDETIAWALEELRAWPHVSPWRVAP